MNLLIFGGTSDARKLAERLQRHSIRFCVTTDYAQQLLPRRDNLEILVGKKPVPEILELLKQETDYIIDATHPYAQSIRASLKKVAELTGVKLLRLRRELSEQEGFPDYESMVDYLSKKEGRILLSSGGNSAKAFTALQDFAERVYVRMLPLPDKMQEIVDLGYAPSHLIAMQGPFSTDFNRVMLRDLKIQYLVTKNSGAAGGFAEKKEAAAAEQVELLILRAEPEEGYLLEDLIDYLEAL